MENPSYVRRMTQFGPFRQESWTHWRWGHSSSNENLLPPDNLVVLKEEDVESRPYEGRKGVLWCMNNGFAMEIKARVHDTGRTVLAAVGCQDIVEV